MNTRIFQWTGFLSGASDADRWAEEIAAALRAEAIVQIDLSEVTRMTPSFANTLVMRLLAEFAIEHLRERCAFERPIPEVALRLRNAVERYQSGIRLSDQPGDGTTRAA